MIQLTKDEAMFTDAGWRVVTGGVYAPDDLVPVYRVSDPDQTVAWYAQYILDGTYP